MEKFVELMVLALRSLETWMKQNPDAPEIKLEQHIAEASLELVMGLTIKETLAIVFQNDAVKAKRAEMNLPNDILEPFARAVVTGHVQEFMIVRYLELEAERRQALAASQKLSV